MRGRVQLRAQKLSYRTFLGLDFLAREYGISVPEMVLRDLKSAGISLVERIDNYFYLGSPQNMRKFKRYVLLAGAYLMRGLEGKADDFPFWLVTLLFCGGLLWYQQRRGTKAQRLPLLLLTTVGLPAVYYATAFLDKGGLQYGGWVFTVGYVLGVAAEVLGLRNAPPVTHAG